MKTDPSSCPMAPFETRSGGLALQSRRATSPVPQWRLEAGLRMEGEDRCADLGGYAVW